MIIPMTPKRGKFSEQIRKAVEASGMSRYAISARTKIDQAALSRFVHGKCGLSLANLDALAEVLKLDVVVRREERKD